MNIYELSGAALDWAVAKCEGIDLFETEGWVYSDGTRAVFRPSTDWRQGGFIIEREWLDVTPWPNESDEEMRWQCEQHDSIDCVAFGTTPLIAAMRCYCCAKLGDEIEVPEALL
jgi:hypothetical protein